MKAFRFFLLPISLVYGIAINIRNFLFNKNILRSTGFNIPIIAVGNLSVGGTGKTPFTELLVRQLQNQYNIGVVCRGYKRSTKGFVLAKNTSTVADIGDEPMQIHSKFPHIPVAVSEKRVEGIQELLRINPNINLIILDDALQHRKLKASINILLTNYRTPFFSDYFLPTGNLRDSKSSSKRADFVIITKTPNTAKTADKEQIKKQIRKYTNVPIFFASLEYGHLYPLFNQENQAAANLLIDAEVLLVTGLANDYEVKAHLKTKFKQVHTISFSDHHTYTNDDIKFIQHKFKTILNKHKHIITTEKDAVKLKSFKAELEQLPFFVLPIEVDLNHK